MAYPIPAGDGVGGGGATTPAPMSLAPQARVADLETLRRIDSRTAETVYMVGRATVGDGGEGVFVWDTTITVDDDDDGTTIFPSNMPVNGGWRRVAADAASPKWWGGRGLADQQYADDDTAAVQAMIDHCCAQRARGRLDGKYIINASLVVGDVDAQVAGPVIDGYARTGAALGSALIAHSSLTGPILKVRNADCGRVNNVAFHGNGSASHCILIEGYEVDARTPRGWVFDGCYTGSARLDNVAVLGTGANAWGDACGLTLINHTFGPCQAGDVTVTAVTPASDTLTAVAHGLAVGELVEVSSTVAVPAGLAASTPYWVQSVPTADTFKLAATKGGAAVDITDAGSGTLKVSHRAEAHFRCSAQYTFGVSLLNCVYGASGQFPAYAVAVEAGSVDVKGGVADPCGVSFAYLGAISGVPIGGLSIDGIEVQSGGKVLVTDTAGKGGTSALRPTVLTGVFGDDITSPTATEMVYWDVGAYGVLNLIGAQLVGDVNVVDAAGEVSCAGAHLLGGSHFTGAGKERVFGTWWESSTPRQRLGGTASISAGAENAGTNTIRVTVTLPVASKSKATVWISDASLGDATATAPNGGVTVANGKKIKELTTSIAWELLSDVNGQIALDVVETTAKSFYINVACDHAPASSLQITFA